MLNVIGQVIVLAFILYYDIALGKSEISETIPFIVQDRVIMNDSFAINRSSSVNIEVGEIQSYLKKIRSAVCDTVGDADIRVWLTVEADGKILGIGASGGAGLEVTFHCGKSIARKKK